MLTDSSLFSLLLCKNLKKLFDTLFSDTKSSAGCKKLSQKIASVTIPGHEQNHIYPLQKAQLGRGGQLPNS